MFSSLIKIFLPLAMAWSSLSFADTNKCADLFTELGSGQRILQPAARRSKFVENYENEIREFQAQQKSGIAVADIKLSLSQNFQKTLRRVQSDLLEVKSEGEFLKNPYLPKEQKGELQKLLDDSLGDLEQILSQKEISYLDSLSINYRYESAMMIRRLAEDKSGLRRTDLRNIAQGNADRAVRGMKKDNALAAIKSLIGLGTQTEKFFRLPSFATIGFRTFNEARAEGVAIIGLAKETVSVDGVQLSPINFFEHDFGHTARYEDVFNGKTLSAKERLDFFRRFDIWSQKDGTDSVQDRLRSAIFFYFFHEGEVPFHPKAFSKAISDWPKDRIGSYYYEQLFVRLENKETDLGQAFKNDKIDRPAIEKEIQEIARFLNASYL